MCCVGELGSDHRKEVGDDDDSLVLFRGERGSRCNASGRGSVPACRPGGSFAIVTAGGLPTIRKS